MKSVYAVWAAVCVVAVNATAERPDDPCSREKELIEMACRIGRFQLERGNLSDGERKRLQDAVDAMERKSRSASSSLLRVENALSDFLLFRKSHAYGFLDAEERAHLQSLVSWLEDKASAPMPELPQSDFQVAGIAAAVPSDLKRGDLVFSRENGFLSHHFVEASTREARFSHVGVVSEVGDSVKIVSVGGGIMSLGEAYETGWDAFVATAVDLAVYRVEGGGDIGECIARAARKRIGTPFDPAFDMKTKDRLYCSELVRDSVNEAVGRVMIGSTRKGSFEYVAIDDCYRNGWIKVFDVKEKK